MSYTYTNPVINWAVDEVSVSVVDPDTGNVVVKSNKLLPDPAFQSTGQLPDNVQGFYPEYYNYALDNLTSNLQETQTNLNTLRNTSITTSDSYLQGGGNLTTNRDITLNTAALIDLIYPVGRILTFADSTNPNTLYAGTTWVKTGEGEVLVGQDTGTFDTLGASVGSEEVTLTAANMPEHDHYMFTGTNGSADDLGRGSLTPANADKAVHVGTTVNTQDDEYSMGASDTGTADKGLTSTAGNASPDAISVVQPSKVVVFWQRTA